MDRDIKTFDVSGRTTWSWLRQHSRLLMYLPQRCQRLLINCILMQILGNIKDCNVSVTMAEDCPKIVSWGGGRYTSVITRAMSKFWTSSETNSWVFIWFYYCSNWFWLNWFLNFLFIEHNWFINLILVKSEFNVKLFCLDTFKCWTINLSANVDHFFSQLMRFSCALCGSNFRIRTA